MTTIEQNTYNLGNDRYVLLLASGSSLKANGVGFHDLVFTASGEKRFLSDVRSLKTADKLLVRLHGAFMIAAWIGTASIGIVLARYFKQTWVESSLCAKDLWFALAGFRKFILFIHMVYITGLAAALIVMVVLAPIGTQWQSLQNKFMGM
uniref:Cytochrome b561 domain-containing protein n=1 Tax=Rhodnius prolixus TaxID=13249 RepID=T1I4J4_RHOPR